MSQSFFCGDPRECSTVSLLQRLLCGALESRPCLLQSGAAENLVAELARRIDAKAERPTLRMEARSDREILEEAVKRFEEFFTDPVHADAAGEPISLKLETSGGYWRLQLFCSKDGALVGFSTESPLKA